MAVERWTGFNRSDGLNRAGISPAGTEDREIVWEGTNAQCRDLGSPVSTKLLLLSETNSREWLQTPRKNQ